MTSLALPPEVLKALSELEPQMRDAFLQAVQRIQSAAQFELVVGHIAAGRFEEALLALRLDPTFFAPLDRAMSEAYWRGGVAALAALPRLKDPFPAAESCSASTDATTGQKLGSGNRQES